MGHSELLLQTQVFLKPDHKRIIAIDGPACVGKFTTASRLATELSLTHVDSGAIYRAVTKLVCDRGINVEDLSEDNCYRMAELAAHVSPLMLLDPMLHSDEVDSKVPKVARIKQVRSKVNCFQYWFANQNPRGSVVEGRDIATKVFPEADIKIFLTASVSARATRQLADTKRRTDLTFEQACRTIAERDHIDKTRKVDPLVVHPEAFVVDNSNMVPDEVHDLILRHIGSKFPNF